eukprot:gb/GECG01016050.1/.p1 GENE.gb/GECG01016050.1/~~gb/GECG01016050.1/.p1  ORF type:complete len:241 (+),score=26.41 gb/GECG01016050.1/:1-723(+)
MKLLKVALSIATMLAYSVHSSCAAVGVDTGSPPVPSQKDYECMKNQSGVSFAIPQCYHTGSFRPGIPYGRFDKHCPNLIQNAWDAGLSAVDIIMYPCVYYCKGSKGPEQQVKEMLGNLSEHGISNKYSTVWISVNHDWFSSKEKNRNFFEGLVSELEKQNQTIGVYTSPHVGYKMNNWKDTMGDWDKGSNYKLWYAHFDGDKNFKEFEPFCGWNKPSMKQYQQTRVLCGKIVNTDWYPSD